MSLRYESPKTLGVKDMFAWWCKQKIRKKRYLKLKYQDSHSMPTMLVSNNSDELEWLRKHVLILAEKIEVLEREDKSNKNFTAKTREIYQKKRELFDYNNRIKHLEQVDNKTTQVVMTEKTFRDVIERFNLGIRDRLINDGSIINMKNKMGYLYIQRINRHEARPDSKSMRMPNWGASYAYRDELIEKGIQVKDKDHPDGKKWMVFYDDDWYLRLVWAKSAGACRVKNHVFYTFKASGGAKSVRKQITESNRNDPLLHKVYKDSYIYKSKLDVNQVKK